jgi:hypothetical protein
MKQLANRRSGYKVTRKSLVMSECLAALARPSSAAPTDIFFAGTRRAVNLSRLLFAYFFLAKQEKLSSRRATPDKR